MKRLGWGVFGAVSFVLAGHFAVGCVGDDPAPTTSVTAEAGPTGTANGATCAVGTDCTSGNCVDGVCCDSACGGTCEACNLPGSIGTCSPVPDGEDPANECPTTPLPDAGDTTQTPTNDGGADAGDASDEGGAVDAGPIFGYPDGGITAQDTKCAGKCNGARACKYPGSDTTCGSVFCGNISTQGRAQCDGQGHCLVGAEDCKTYSCPDGSQGCKSTCTSEADCAEGSYCDATTNTCKPRAANASACTSSIQCQSGYCKDSVCCNDGCDIPQGTCAKPGYVGQCVCSACPGGTCALWYKDEDGDLHGDMYGTVANGGAVYGCAAGPAPTLAGHPAVANKDDCYDKNDAVGNSIHPGQQGWFTASYTPILGGNPSWDYDCSGTRDTFYPEYPGGQCGYCQFVININTGLRYCARYTTCTATGTQQTGFTCGGGSVVLGCGAANPGPAFENTITCGSTSTLVTCGACNGAGTLQQSYTYNVQQKCH